jgi:hypothetical protein
LWKIHLRYVLYLTIASQRGVLADAVCCVLPSIWDRENVREVPRKARRWSR